MTTRESLTRIALFLLAFIVVKSVFAHQRLVYPVPRSTNSGLKSYPCGGVARDSSQQVTTLNANTEVEIHFEETISHSGAPFRIAMSYDDDSHFDELILQDHIPHNDLSGSFSDTNTKKYAYNITIPDVTCDSCALQIVNPMTDKINEGSCCYYPSTAEKYGHQYCSSVYVSCANIRIVGGSKSLSDYAKSYKYTGAFGPYTQESATYTENLKYGYRLADANPTHFLNSCNGFTMNDTNNNNNNSEMSESGAHSTVHHLLVVVVAVAAAAVVVIF